VRLLRDIVVDGYVLNQGTADLVMALVRKHRPVALQGFTSMLAFVAKAVLDGHGALPRGTVQVAWNGGEMLYPEQNELFQRAFGVPILNRYGGRELSVMACQFAAGGPLHVLRPWQFVEVVDSAGKPVAAGESGRLIWTNTVCRGTPLLRYEIGDLGSFDPGHGSEAGITHLAGIEGRFSGLLTLPNGKIMNCVYWNHLFKEFPEVRQFQIVVKSAGGLEIRLEGEGITPGRDSLLHRILRNFLGNVPFQVAWVEQVPRTRRGKLVQVVYEPETKSSADQTEATLRGTT
jgi:phenylacetate-CoA ligase